MAWRSHSLHMQLWLATSSFFSIDYAKAFSVKTILCALCLALLTMTTGSLTFSCICYDPVIVDRVAYLMAQHANNASICDHSWRPRSDMARGLRRDSYPRPGLQRAPFERPCFAQLTDSADQIFITTIALIHSSVFITLEKRTPALPSLPGADLEL